MAFSRYVIWTLRHIWSNRNSIYTFYQNDQISKDYSRIPTCILISKILYMSKIGWCKEWVGQVGKELEKSSFWSPKAKRNKLTTRACTPRIPLIRPSWRSRSWLTSCQFLQEWCLQELTPSVIKWPWKLEPMSAVKVERQSKYALTILSLRSPLWLRPKYCFIFITMNL